MSAPPGPSHSPGPPRTAVGRSGSGRRARARGETSARNARSEVELEPDVIADALEDHALQIVAEDRAGDAVEVRAELMVLN